MTVDLEVAVSQRNIKALTDGASFHLSKSACRTVSRSLGEAYNEELLDAILANPQARVHLDYQEVMNATLTDDSAHIASKVAKNAPYINQIFKAIANATSYKQIETIQVLLKRAELKQTLADCRNPSTSHDTSLLD